MCCSNYGETCRSEPDDQRLYWAKLTKSISRMQHPCKISPITGVQAATFRGWLSGSKRLKSPIISLASLQVSSGTYLKQRKIRVHWRYQSLNNILSGRPVGLPWIVVHFQQNIYKSRSSARLLFQEIRQLFHEPLIEDQQQLPVSLLIEEILTNFPQLHPQFLISIKLSRETPAVV